jgi:aldehyde dehydrogenase (NAD+)
MTQIVDQTEQAGAVGPETLDGVFARQELYIGGKWIDASTRDRIPVVNPYTETEIGSVPEANREDADAAIAAAVEAFREDHPWQRMTYLDRAEVLCRIADELEKRHDLMAASYMYDFGGLHSRGQFQSRVNATVFRQHLEHARALPSEPEAVSPPGVKALLTYEAKGPVLTIVPWNGAFPLASMKIAPALLAGNPVVVKTASEVPTAAFILAEAFEAAGMPEGMISILPGRSSTFGDLAARPEFAHVSFTGSTESGRNIMRSAAENITPVTLELGGKSAGIILEDVDPSEAAPFILNGCLGQSGQVCTTYARLLVPASRGEEWKRALTELYANLRIGDPTDPSVEMGPLVSDKQRASVEGYLEMAVQDGATVLTGGKRPANLPTGYFLEPTLLFDVKNSDRIVREEIFGPVTTLQYYDDIDEAVALANDSDYGLGAGIFTNDEEAGRAVAMRIRAGAVSINLAGSCVYLPFGGYKKSGIGREGGMEGVLEMLEIKQVQLSRDY